MIVNLSEDHQGQEAEGSPAVKATSDQLTCLSSGQKERPQHAQELSFSFLLFSNSYVSVVSMDI